MRFIVVQLGARRGYAVPSILAQAGMLERFYTDLAGNVGAGEWLVRVGRLCGLRSAANKLSQRRIPDSIRKQTVSFVSPCTWLLSNLRFPGAQAHRFRRQLRRSSALGRAMVRRGFGQATHLYSMLGECSSLLAAARTAGLRVVTEFYILLSAECIVAEEQQGFPGWEPPVQDFERIRAEFPDEAKIVERTDFAICPSEGVQFDLERSFGFPAGRSAVVPYGVDPTWLELEARPVPGRILFVGTAGLRKGIQYLASAACELHARGRHYEFHVAGDVSPSVRGQSVCRFLRFLGRIPRTNVCQQFATADVFVLPTLAEGSAEVTYEALGAGVPVITTVASGSVVRDQIDGCIVPIRDANALADAIERLVECRELRAQYSAAARLGARDFTWDCYGERLISALLGFKK